MPERVRYYPKIPPVNHGHRDPRPQEEDGALGNPNGFDIARPTGKRRGASYEQICFSTFLVPDYAFLVGPNVVNDVLAMSPFSGLGKPDAMRFRLQGDTWVLIGLHEYKSGPNLEVRRKLHLFSTLLHHLRDDKEERDMFLKCLIEVLGRGRCDLPMPRVIEIPPETEIPVLFVSPHSHGTVYQRNGTQFPVTTLVVDNPKRR